MSAIVYDYRISKLCWGLDLRVVDPVEVTKRVVNGVFNGVTTVELDNLAAEVGLIGHYRGQMCI